MLWFADIQYKIIPFSMGFIFLVHVGILIFGFVWADQWHSFSEKNTSVPVAGDNQWIRPFAQQSIMLLIGVHMTAVSMEGLFTI